MIAKALSQIALDFCGITDIHRNGSSVHCCHYEYDYLMQRYLASICHDFLCLNFLCVPGNLPAMCRPMGTSGDITCLTGTASHMVANFWDGI